MALSIAFQRVVKALGGKRAAKKILGDAYWDIQWQIMTEES
jgi:hypothetical protein